MRKIFVLLLLSLILFASRVDTERKIYDTVIHILLPQAKKVRVWSDSKSLNIELESLKDVTIVTDINNAQIAIVTGENVPKKCSCLLFVTSYKQLKKYQDRAVGGFFWQKGRPNIVFLKKNLQKHGIEVPKSMQQFVEDEL